MFRLSFTKLRQTPLISTYVVLAIFVSATVVVLSELSHQRLAHVNQTLTTSLRMAALSNEVLLLTVDAETGERGFLLTEREEYLEPYRQAVSMLLPKIGELGKLAIEDAAQRDRIEHINHLIGKKLADLESTMTLYRDKGKDEAMQLFNTDLGRNTMDQIRRQAADLNSAERARVAENFTRWNQDLLVSRVGVAVVTALNLVLLLMVYLLAVREFEARSRAAADAEEEQRRLERLVEQRTAILSELSSSLQTAQEHERERIARDIHDELGSALVASRMDISWVVARLQSLDPELTQKLARAMGTLDEAVQIKRRIMEELRPAVLDSLGLSAAIDWLASETSGRAGIECSTDLPEEDLELAPDVAIALFRIVQESLTNIVKYSQAQQASIALKQVPGGLFLEIFDKGQGISEGALNNPLSHGIAGMRQRVVALRGRFDIVSTPNMGTRISVFVPVEHNEVAVPAQSTLGGT